jgi:putative aminopeptidase FrvX
MFSHNGRVRSDSLDDRAFMALSISMTTKIDKETVDADLAMSFENI